MNLAVEQTQMTNNRNLTGPELKKRRIENNLERHELVDTILKEGAYYNFPKIHLISHYVEQIEKYDSLPQWSTEIYKSSHKPLKNAYHWSNHINTTMQVIQTFTRDHTLKMHFNNLEAWSEELSHVYEKTKSMICRTYTSLKLPENSNAPLKLKLQGRQPVKEISQLSDLAAVFELPDIEQLGRIYFRKNVFEESNDPVLDANRLIQGLIEAFNTL
ncbi:hypothetical protein RUND412_007981 [Rhizina undulata]